MGPRLNDVNSKGRVCPGQTSWEGNALTQKASRVFHRLSSRSLKLPDMQDLPSGAQALHPSRQEPQFRTLRLGRFAVQLFQLQPHPTFHLPWESTLDTSVPGRRTRTGGRCGSDTASASRSPTPKEEYRAGSRSASISYMPKTLPISSIESLQARSDFSSALQLAQKLGMPITTHWLCGINHLRLLLHPSVVHCGQEGIRCGRYPNLPSFRPLRGAAASARFREIGVFDGFVPPDCLPRLLRRSQACRQPYKIEFKSLNKRHRHRQPP